MNRHYHHHAHHADGKQKPPASTPVTLDLQHLVGHTHPIDEKRTIQCAKAINLAYERAGIIVGTSKNNATIRAIDDLVRHFHAKSPEDLLSALESDSRHPAWPLFISKFTVNHTNFMREPHHFEQFKKFLKEQSGTPVVWCSAASTGEEPYSIVMAANEIGVRIKCIATDIDEAAIQKAKAGVYDIERVSPLGEARLRQFFLKGTDGFKGKVKVKPEVSSQIEFGVFNLNEKIWPSTGLSTGPFDAIFCRNVMIYFDRETQIKLLARFARVIKKNGILLVGHSENIGPLTKDFKLLGQTVYTKP